MTLIGRHVQPQKFHRLLTDAEVGGEVGYVKTGFLVFREERIELKLNGVANNLETIHIAFIQRQPKVIVIKSVLYAVFARLIGELRLLN